MGRSKRGTLATYPARDSGGSGLKVCAAVSPVFGLVMHDTQLTAWNGTSFSHFMNRLCALPHIKKRNMIFVMDNVALHFAEPVMDAMRGQYSKHTIERLPVYSPHLNPIEYCFHNWKNAIKHIDQVHDKRTLQQQVDDTRVCVTGELVTNILNHVYQLYAHCIEEKKLEDFQPIGHRVSRAQQEAALQRDIIRIRADADEKEEKTE